jgi:hypothetical protein
MFKKVLNMFSSKFLKNPQIRGIRSYSPFEFLFHVLSHGHSMLKYGHLNVGVSMFV